MPKHLSRRQLLTGTSSALAATLLAACGSSQPSTANTSATPSLNPLVGSPATSAPAAPTSHASGHSTPAASATLDRQPFLQALSTTGVTISWKLATGKDSWLRIGPVGGPTRRIAAQGKSGDIAVTDLKPNTSYVYDIGVGEASLTQPVTFRSAPGSDVSAFSFIAFGDSGEGDPIQRSLAAQMLALQPDMTIHVGDYVYGKDGTFDNRYFQVYADLIAKTTVFPAIGDNEDQDNGGKPFQRAFILPPNAPPTGKTRAYSFDYGAAHFIALDTESAFDTESPQTKWLVADLASTKLPWKFVYFHRPAYSVEVERSHLDIRAAWCPLFERYGVAAVFSGHDHNYQRTSPIRDYSTGTGGVVYIITGGGGATLRPDAPGGTTVAAESVNHVVHIQVQGDTATLRAVKDDGSVFDEATINRGGA